MVRLIEIPRYEDLSEEERQRFFGDCESFGRFTAFLSRETFEMNVFDQLVDAANSSNEFRVRLLADPQAAAREAGVSLPAGASLVVHEDTVNTMRLVIGGQTEDLPEEAVKLLVRAQQDAGFKAQLIADPVGTARVEFGAVLPTTLTVVVLENTPNELHIVLPPAESAEGELSDMELEAVAGGKGRRRRRSGGGGGGGGGGNGSSNTTGYVQPGSLAICT